MADDCVSKSSTIMALCLTVIFAKLCIIYEVSEMYPAHGDRRSGFLMLLTDQLAAGSLSNVD